MNERYIVLQESNADDLETELNKDDYKLYEVVSIAYGNSKVICVLEKRYFE